MMISTSVIHCTSFSTAPTQTHSLDYESQENSIVQKLLCKAQFTRFMLILMSLVILQVFAAYKRKGVFSIMGHLET